MVREPVIPSISYRKGPLGHSVALDGEAVGAILWMPAFRLWSVRVRGLQADLEHRDQAMGRTLFASLALAKSAVGRHFHVAGAAMPDTQPKRTCA